jgi:hypothetical protein
LALPFFSQSKFMKPRKPLREATELADRL